MNILDQLNEIKAQVVLQLDNIDLSKVDIENKTKLQTGINKLKIKLKDGQVNLQDEIQRIINEVQSTK
jgi:hypothetical protein